MTIYINPFLLGILATLAAELIALVVGGIIWSIRQKAKGKQER